MSEKQFTKVGKETREELIVKKESESFFDQVSQNYAKRFDEVEHFSKHLHNMYSDLNSECLRGCLNTIQHLVEMQKKHPGRFQMYEPDHILNWMEQNNRAWIQAVENIDTIYSNFLDNCKNIMRMYNENCQNCIQFFERNYEFMSSTPNLEEIR